MGDVITAGVSEMHIAGQYIRLLRVVGNRPGTAGTCLAGGGVVAPGGAAEKGVDEPGSVSARCGTAPPNDSFVEHLDREALIALGTRGRDKPLTLETIHHHISCTRQCFLLLSRPGTPGPAS